MLRCCIICTDNEHGDSWILVMLSDCRLVTLAGSYMNKNIKKKSRFQGGPDAQKCLEKITKMKNDLMTNKDYDPFTIDTPEGQKWNNWIENLVNKKYYNNTWLFTECYVYRRLYEACELT